MKPRCCQNSRINDEISNVTGFLKVIAEENRLRILCMLRSGERCVCDIWQFLNLPQNLTSHHLRVLKEFGVVEDRKDGLKVYYSLNKEKISQYYSLISNFLQNNMETKNKVQVLGSGCPSCKKLFDITSQAVQELGIDAEVEYVTDIQKIIEMGVMQTPVLAINEVPLMTGTVSDLERVKRLISDNLSNKEAEDKPVCDCGGNC